MTQFLGWVDYLVCGIMLAISSCIGIYYRFTGGKQVTNEEYLLASGQAKVLPVAFSLMATFMSSITLLGTSAENFTYGTQFVIINLAYAVGTPIAAHFYMPVFFKLKATSVYEYLERRFGQKARLAASFAFSLQMILYLGIVLYAPAIALQAVTGLDLVIAILAMGGVCIFYSTIGGMKAVLITDVFQSLLMFAAVFTVIISALVEKGGFAGIWEIAEAHGRIELLNFSPDPTTRHTWWTQVIGGALLFLSLYAVNQAQVQRYLSVKDLKAAQKALYLNWPILTLLSLSTSFAGLAMFAKYADCDPILTKRISSPDQIMPLYVLDTLGNLPGIPGLFVAGIFSGALSSISGGLNSLSAVTVEDYIKPLVNRFRGEPMTESSAVFTTKVMCLVYGAVCLGLAFATRYLGAILQAALVVFGVVGGPLLAIFTLGMVFPLANELGSVVGLMAGLAFGLWLSFGGPKPPPPVLPTWASNETCSEFNITIPPGLQNTTKPTQTTDFFYLYRISYQWYILLGFFLTIGLGLLVSWLSVKYGLVPHSDPHPDLFAPPIARIQRRKLQQTQDVLEIGSGGPIAIVKRTSNSKDEQLNANILSSDKSSNL